MEKISHEQIKARRGTVLVGSGAMKTYGWFILWLCLLLTALICRPPLPIDETRYLSVAWEMWQSDQFLVPHINGIPYSHKPPLLFWLIQAGWSIFGVNEWTARMTAPIFGLFAVLLTIRFSRMLWPKQRELHQNIPYLLLGVCFWALYGTLTMFDMLVACCAIGAWIGLWFAGYCLERPQGLESWLRGRLYLFISFLQPCLAPGGWKGGLFIHGSAGMVVCLLQLQPEC